mmetsp:Transcript_33639/g.103565  ORF Transcript_33639/g.103565 Transcript_33639/m.103565 type:complete len:379 (+) Transcript_33639:3-1139(+)
MMDPSCPGMMGPCGAAMPGKGLLGMMGKGGPCPLPLLGKGGPGMLGMAGPGMLGMGGPAMLGMGGAAALRPPERVDVNAPMGAGDKAPTALGTSSTLKEDPNGMEGLCEKLKDFRRKWDIELRFEPKIIEHLGKKGKGWAQELKRLDDDLQEAQVPPVCRSGYLLVLFGTVTEQNTDEDFRKILCPNLVGEERKEGDGDGDGEQENSSGGGGGRGAGAGTDLQEEWMTNDIREFCSRFNIDEPQKTRLTNAMSSRASTFKEDMNTLTSALKAARHPPGLLSLRLREMENGTFQTRGWLPAEEANRLAAAAAERPRSRSRERRRERSRSRERRRERSKSRERRRRSRSRSRRGDKDRDRERGRRDREEAAPAEQEPKEE